MEKPAQHRQQLTLDRFTNDIAAALEKKPTAKNGRFVFLVEHRFSSGDFADAAKAAGYAIRKEQAGVFTITRDGEELSVEAYTFGKNNQFAIEAIQAAPDRTSPPSQDQYRK
ncbi:MAG: hypothetical protein OXR66_04505 [Candidatus Woesearchaeota archaeon]|nr:hypothetical protein [Candidatus Woesearchaeota archaeon]